MTPDEFRARGHALIDWIADYRATLADRPVIAATAPGQLKAALPAAPPESPEPFDAVLSPTSTRSWSPGSPTGSTRGSAATSRRTHRSPASSATF
jgi:hypothetical protein